MFNAKTKNNLITKDEADWVVDIVSKIEPWEGGYGSDFWDNRSLNAPNIYLNHNEELGKFLFDLRTKIKLEIMDMYSLKEEVYPDLTQVVRWFPGMEQPPHSDDMENTADHDINKHRNFGAILYLNDNYSGGHTYYPQHNIEIIPEVGKLAVHPGDTNHIHGVSKINDSVRYTIASFWTFDEEFYDNWQIHQ